MEGLTLEKAISFSTNIESLQNLSIKDSIDYKLLDDGCSVIGVVKVCGAATTLKGIEPFEENIDVDIFAPFDQVIDKSKFSLKVNDYNYQILRNTAVFKIDLEITGFRKIQEEKHTFETDSFNMTNEIDEILDDDPISYDDDLLQEFQKNILEMDDSQTADDDIKNDINGINKIEDSTSLQSDENSTSEKETMIVIPNVKPNFLILNQKKEKESREEKVFSWATDLFKEKDQYVTFVKIHRQDVDDSK